MNAEDFYNLIEGNYALIQGRKWDTDKVNALSNYF